MYLIKNAWKNIRRSLGKNILIGIIILIVALSSCLALSIKQAAKKTEEQGLSDINVTANISYDRKSMMEDMQPPTDSSDLNDETSEEDRKAKMKEMFSSQSLSLNELKSYAKASSVKDFYYTMQASLNGNDSLSAIESESDDNAPEGMQGKGKEMESGDFTMIAYSSYDAMSEFQSGVKSIDEGSLFSLESENECIISDELALYNSLEVGDTITFVNPDNSEETFTLTIVGTYTSSDTSSAGFMSSDPANQIYTNYQTLNTMVKTSKANSANSEDSTYISGQVNGTYVFDSVEDYEKFDTQARKLGLDDSYTISSTDITAYEQSLEPLLNLSNYATIFLWIILVIGGIILLIFNIFRLKERKYEIGVLAAIGMNKAKIAFQFMMEMFIITFLSIIIGAGIGSAISVPITNSLLANSTTTNTMDSQMPEGMSTPPNQGNSNNDNVTFGGRDKPQSNVDYISEISSATDIVVIIQLLGIGILLTIISGGISVFVILRYEPLKILSNRE